MASFSLGCRVARRRVNCRRFAVAPSRRSPAKASVSNAASSSAVTTSRGPAGVAVAGGDLRRLSEQEIALEQNKIINEVADLLGIPPECARTVLIHFKWNKDKLFDAYYADSAKVRADTGIKHLGVAGHAPGPFMCEICLDEYPAREGFSLGCKHVFCRPCWSGFLSSAVADEGAGCIFKRCPAENCGEAVTMSVVKAMAPADVAAKWAMFELKHFVTISKDMAWCPGAGE